MFKKSKGGHGNGKLDAKLEPPVSMTVRSHLFPFRTQKLSSLVPKIVGWTRPVKIGRCRRLKNKPSRMFPRGFLACLTTRSRGNPFLRAVARQKFLPPSSLALSRFLRRDKRLQKPERCASVSSLLRPQDALRCRCPLGTKFSAEPCTRPKGPRTLSAPNFPGCVPSSRTCRLDGTFLSVLAV